jgi:hypothetical protein
MADSIRDRLRRILNGNPNQRLAQPDRASSAIRAASRSEVNTMPIEQTSAPIRPAASLDATVPTRPIDPMPAEVHQTPAMLRPLKPDSLGDVNEARAFIENLRQKMAALAEDFATGRINRQQFESVYGHYREQRQMVESLLNSMTSSAWRRAVAEGETAMLLKRSTAKVMSYAIYANLSGVLLASSGNFKIDPAVVVPMLSAYRSATAEAFGAGIRNSEIEGGHWLTFVPGRFTTFIALFTLEPAREQLTLLEDLHRDFETANAVTLQHGEIEEIQTAAEQFLNLWSLGRSN